MVKDRPGQQAPLLTGELSRRQRRDDQAGQPFESEPGASQFEPEPGTSGAAPSITPSLQSPPVPQIQGDDVRFQAPANGELLPGSP